MLFQEFVHASKRLRYQSLHGIKEIFIFYVGTVSTSVALKSRAKDVFNAVALSEVATLSRRLCKEDGVLRGEEGVLK